MRKLTLITLALIFSGSTAAFACGDGWVQIPNSNACMRTTPTESAERDPLFYANEVQGAQIGEPPMRGNGYEEGEIVPEIEVVDGSMFGF